MESFIYRCHVEKLVTDTADRKKVNPRDKLTGLKFLRDKMREHIHSDALRLLDEQIAQLEAELFSKE